GQTDRRVQTRPLPHACPSLPYRPDAAMEAGGALFSLGVRRGIVLGTIRVLVVVPLFGERTAELLEMPLMLIVIVAAARWINRRYPEVHERSAQIRIGLMALGLVLAADLVVGVALRGMSPLEALSHRDPISGTAYCLSLLLFAAMPWLLSRR
ncbi:MAG: hypothetical protein ACT4OL_07550, partial [Nitrospiraceae bacterium]